MKSLKIFYRQQTEELENVMYLIQWIVYSSRNLRSSIRNIFSLDKDFRFCFILSSAIRKLWPSRIKVVNRKSTPNFPYLHRDDKIGTLLTFRVRKSWKKVTDLCNNTYNWRKRRKVSVLEPRTHTSELTSHSRRWSKIRKWQRKIVVSSPFRTTILYDEIC